MAVRQFGNHRGMGQIDCSAGAQVMCIFECHQPGRGEMRVRRMFKFLAQLVKVEFAAGVVLNRRHHHPAERSGAASFVSVSMSLRTEKGLGATSTMSKYRSEVSHRAAW